MCVVGVGCCVGTVDIQHLNVKLSVFLPIVSGGSGSDLWSLHENGEGNVCVCVLGGGWVGSSREAKFL